MTKKVLLALFLLYSFWGCKTVEILPPDEKSGGFENGISDVYCKIITIDWYSVTCSGGVCYTSFMYSETKMICQSTPSGGAGGVTAGGEYVGFIGNGSALFGPSQTTGQLDLIKQSSSLIPAYYINLKEKLNDLLDECLPKSMYGGLLANGMKFNFSINPSQPAPGTFNPANNNLVFKSLSAMDNRQVLLEELFHGFQDSFYAGGTTQYVYNGRPNIEFEAKFFTDIVAALNGFQPGLILSSSFVNSPIDNAAYFNWIYDMTAGGNKVPTSFDIDKYFYFMNKFKVSATEYNKPVIYTLLPEALLNILNASNCPK